MKDVITSREVGRYASYGAILVTIVLSWASLSTQLALQGQKLDFSNEKLANVTKVQEGLNTNYNSLDKRVAVIERVITNGGLTQAQSKEIIALAAPTIAGSSATPTPPQVTYNTTFAPEPTPLPAPTQAPILCVLTICL